MVFVVELGEEVEVSRLESFARGRDVVERKGEPEKLT